MDVQNYAVDIIDSTLIVWFWKEEGEKIVILIIESLNFTRNIQLNEWYIFCKISNFIIIHILLTLLQNLYTKFTDICIL